MRNKIKEHISANGGRISFADYMQLALYAPGYGYYSSGKVKFGRGGDFVTAPELGECFAKCLAMQCRQIFEHLPVKNILEIGAGTGKLARDLQQLLGDSLDQYYILELSAELQQRQAQLAPGAKFLNTLPENFTGIIIANEVLDAMPVSKFFYNQGKLQEFYVTQDFAFAIGEPTAQLKRYFEEIELNKHLTDNYTSEVNLWLPGWIKSLDHSLQQGVILLFDYGFPRAEYYHPQRNTGTLMCHYQHKCHSDPLHMPGEQDITAHVDFTAVAEAACAVGLEIGGFNNLASFLINCGLLAGDPGSHSTSSRRMTETQAITHEINMLTSPAEMGELFKAMALTKNFDAVLCGFSNYDRTVTL